MNGSFPRWSQRFVKDGGNGDDADVLGCFQIVPVIDN